MSELPHMVPVQSSNVEAIGHRNNELHVRFKGGGHYIYSGVPESMYHDALKAESVGKWIAANVKGKHDHRKH